MATDGPTPAPCDPEIYKSGEVVFVTNTIPSNAMEQWVRAVAKESGQPVDWHFVGGRAVVLALGNTLRVKVAIRTLLPEHDALFRIACKKFDVACEPPRPGWFEPWMTPGWQPPPR